MGQIGLGWLGLGHKNGTMPVCLLAGGGWKVGEGETPLHLHLLQGQECISHVWNWGMGANVAWSLILGQLWGNWATNRQPTGLPRGKVCLG